IKTADWIVDLGPEGGDRGGRIIAEGTPEEVARVRESATGEYLARVLRGEPLVPLSDVTFADEAGRGPSRNGNGNGRSRKPRPIASTRFASSCSTPTAGKWPAQRAASRHAASATAGTRC